jgi:hypothetical protein
MSERRVNVRGGAMCAQVLSMSGWSGYAVFWMRSVLDAQCSRCAVFWMRSVLDAQCSGCAVFWMRSVLDVQAFSGWSGCERVLSMPMSTAASDHAERDRDVNRGEPPLCRAHQGRGARRRPRQAR